MKDGTQKTKIGFVDSIYIHFSDEDGCWVAHSLRTDQLGIGDDVVTALACLIRGIDSLLKLAKVDETVAYLREAPAEIQELAKHAKPLIKELFEIAHKKALGQWPAEQPVKVEPKEDESFITEPEEMVC